MTTARVESLPLRVPAEVGHLIRALARPEGGFIPLAECGKDHRIVPEANVMAMSDAFERYARSGAL
jgi:hypothetical protein